MTDDTSADPFELQRFVRAQDGVYSRVVSELAGCRKRGHWMWFVFPQLTGLGHSATARRFAISGLDEARAFADHPLLGARLRECTSLVLACTGRSADEIFGNPDNLKFRSSMTLFREATPDNGVFLLALQKHYGGVGDPLTVKALASAPV